MDNEKENLEVEIEEEEKSKFPVGWVVFFGILLTLIIACIIVIKCL